MNRAVRWLSLIGLIASMMVLYGGLAHAQGGVTVQVVCQQYLRPQPDEDAERVGLMNPGEVHVAVGRWGDWVLVQVNPALWGWAYDGPCITLQGDFNALPVVDPDQLQAQVETIVQTSQPRLRVACTQYVRTYPDTDAVDIALMYPTDPPWTVLGRNADSSWLLVMNADGGFMGWTAYGNCVSVVGDFSLIPQVEPTAPSSAYGGPPIAQVACTQYVRTLPDTDATDIAIMYPTDPAWSILGRNTDASWLWVSNADGGFVGWTSNSDCVTVYGDLSAVPEVAATAPVMPVIGPAMLNVACTQYVRTYPSVDSQDIAIMYPTDLAWSILGRNADASWLWISNADGSFVGWTSNSDCVTVSGDVEAIPEVAPSATISTYSGPAIATAVCDQYLRAYPSTEGRHLAVLNAASGALIVMGRTQDNDWLYVRLSNGSEGWTANGDCLNVQGDYLQAPILEPPALTGPPTMQVLCEQYVRAQPSSDATDFAIMYIGDPPWRILGRNGDGSWLLVSNADGGFIGWTAADTGCISVRGDVFNAPEVTDITPEYLGPPIAQIACTQYLRSVPDPEGRRLHIMTADTGPYHIVGRNADSSWLLLLQRDGSQGWAAQGDCLNVLGDLTRVPVVAPQVAYDGPPVARLVCTQYLRSIPDPEGRTLTILDGTQGPLSITGRTPDLAWMQITLLDGTVGWAATGACLDVQGSLVNVPENAVGAVPYDGPPIATVQCTQYLRALPDEESVALVILDGTQGMLRIIGRTSDEAWMQIGLLDGTVGWAATGACLNVLGNFYDAPVVEVISPTYSGPPIATAVCTQYLRTRPDEESDRVAILGPEDGLIGILGRNENTSWLYVQRADGLTGWSAYGACLVTQGNLLAVPIVEVQEYEGPPLADIVCDVNLRRNPLGDAETMTVLTPASGFFNVVGRDDESDWALVEHTSGLVGWVSLGDCVSVQGNILDAPTPASVVRDPELWTVLRAAGGACDGSDQASQIIMSYNRTGPIGPVSRQCADDQAAILALTRFQAEVAIVSGSCPGFQQVPLSGGQSFCHRMLRTTQVDDFMDYARAQ